MLSQAELKKELLEIQSLAESKFQENVYQRLLVTTITLLITISALVIIISFFIRMFFDGETLIGDYLLNLGTDFIGSTIIFVVFSIIIKPKDTSESSKIKFKTAITIVLSVAVIAFAAALLNNKTSLVVYRPFVDLIDCSGDRINIPCYQNSPFDGDEQRQVLYSLANENLLNDHIESYYGQDFVNAFLLNISTQFLGSLIIFIGVEELFRIFERQQENQMAMLRRIDQLNLKLE